jgi:ribose transport system substrate-binding protein
MKSALAVLAVLLFPFAALPAMATPRAPVIALSNAYYGNTWRHQMVEAFEAAAKQAKSEGKIADYIVMNGDGSVAEQNSQIGELILKKVDVLLVDAASETADNGVIEKACKAGIIVISFDSIANAPCNYQLNFDFKGYKAQQAEEVFKMLHGKGDVIQVRGVKGSAPDNDMYNAQVSVLKKYPGIKVVATVYGQATASVAQSAIANVLPSLPHVDAVLGQGGSDDVGIAQAFTQYGDGYVNHMPIIEGGGGTDFIKWWAAENKKNGVSVLEGAKAPKLMIMPVATVDASNLAEYAKLPSGRIVSPTYSLEWVKKNLLSK